MTLEQSAMRHAVKQRVARLDSDWQRHEVERQEAARLIDHQAVHVLDARRCSVVYMTSCTAAASRSALFGGAAKHIWEMRFDLTR